MQAPVFAVRNRWSHNEELRPLFVCGTASTQTTTNFIIFFGRTSGPSRTFLGWDVALHIQDV